jgi:hypothetical protein
LKDNLLLNLQDAIVQLVGSLIPFSKCMELFADITDVGVDDVFPLVTEDKTLSSWIKTLASASLQLVVSERDEMFLIEIPDDASAASFARKLKEFVKIIRHRYIASQVIVMLQVLGVSLKLSGSKSDAVPVIEYSTAFHETIELKNPNNKNCFIMEMEFYVDQLCVDDAFDDSLAEQQEKFFEALKGYAPSFHISRFEKMSEVSKLVESCEESAHIYSCQYRQALKSHNVKPS